MKPIILGVFFPHRRLVGIVGAGLLSACSGTVGDPEPTAQTTSDLQVLHCSMSYCDGHAPPPPCWQLECNWVFAGLGHPVMPTCEQVPLPGGDPCAEPISCINAGTCDGAGTCVASPGQTLVCSPTMLGMIDEEHCLCVDSQCASILPGGSSQYPASPQICQSTWR